jgi:Lhr-like helicase
MVRKNKSIGRGHIQITPELVVEIAQMSRDNNVQKNNSKKSTAKRKYNIEDRDIQEIISLIDRNKKNRTSANAFTVERTHTHRRFGYNEYVYDVAIGANKASTLPDFLNNLREVFSYLINVMKYIASSGTDKARFYISKAPRTAFSTAVLDVSDFNVQMFLIFLNDICKAMLKR